MLRKLIDKVYAHKLEDEKQAVINILHKNIDDLQIRALMEVDSEVDEMIAEMYAPPDEAEIAAKFPPLCEGCEE